MVVNRVGVLYHPMIDAAAALAGEVEQFLADRGISVWLCSAWEVELAKSKLDGTGLILTVGGDGTILRAAHVAVSGQIPITGINLGKLGFMTELGADEAKDVLPALIAGEGWIDERAMLEVELSLSGQESGLPLKFYALNDVVVSRGQVARVLYIETGVSDEPLTTYKADGVIVASATGSTGYSLAAGGPILHPRAKEILLLPIIPHLSLPYCLALPATAVVSLKVTSAHQAELSIDGHVNFSLDSGSVITVRQSSAMTRFLRFYPNSFYSNLELRLKGKQ